MLWILLITIFPVDVLSDSQSIVSQKLDVNYDKRLSPWRDRPVEVTVSVPLMMLLELKENEMQASWIFMTSFSWHDHRLSFDSEFHRVDRFFVPSTEVWTPNFFVFNSIETRDAYGGDEYNDVEIASDGTVTMRLTQHASCVCEIDVERFPFDVQFCSLGFSSPITPTSRMILKPVLDKKNVMIMGNSEFRFFNFSLQNNYYGIGNETYQKVFFIAHLSRFSTYYIVVVVVPTYIIVVQAIAGALLPMDMGSPNDVTNLGLGSLLALLFMMSIVVNQLPMTTGLAWLGYFIIQELGLCVVAVALGTTISILRHRFSFDVEPPLWLRSLTLVRSGEGLWKNIANESRPPSIKSLTKARKAVWDAMLWRTYLLVFCLFQMANMVVVIVFLSYSWLPNPKTAYIGF